MHYIHRKISKAVLDYCVKNKTADAALMAKWKKPGYERLCSTYVINPDYICRVPHTQRSAELKFAQDPTTGCMGCASGKGAGPKNIFGNKYGQRLAAVQIAREQRMEAVAKEESEAAAKAAKAAGAGDSFTDESSDDDDDYGPTPIAGVWAGSDKLQKRSEALTFGGGDDVDDDDDADGDVETDDEEDDVDGATDSGKSCAKKVRSDIA
eukprot:CAMPEP_0116030200 /NCGR_PEP_ID=MMETSP0321-20121206/16704_1 /TAXON_ID=163516 /ORGANISM="Leptocylindrus danicus var. danicus, Strain B650" /LENGTH=208 /DNA_ID=CAMNT_0003504943 /DNA_START=24 /DNA_END=651 /DNA_ORIENTATION=+